MNYRKDKVERLVRAAHMYYEEDRTQGEIADHLHVSRPLVSRMLREARELGIVEIRVHVPEDDTEARMDRLCRQFGLQGGVLIAEEDRDSQIDQNLAKCLLEYVEAEQPAVIGIGWGDIIGSLTELIERTPQRSTSVQTVCPLVGNSTVSSRRYHTDENVRIIAKNMCAQPKYLHAPAFFADAADRSLLYDTRHYQEIAEQWDRMDIALVGIQDTTATGDMDYPMELYGGSIGHFIAYTYDIQGQFIRPERDCVAHIPLDQLAKCRQVIGLCAADVSPQAVLGALRTGILTHLFARESLADALLREEA